MELVVLIEEIGKNIFRKGSVMSFGSIDERILKIPNLVVVGKKYVTSRQDIRDYLEEQLKILTNSYNEEADLNFLCLLNCLPAELNQEYFMGYISLDNIRKKHRWIFESVY